MASSEDRRRRARGSSILFAFSFECEQNEDVAHQAHKLAVELLSALGGFGIGALILEKRIAE